MPEKKYTADNLTVTFDPERCIHSENCIHSLPDVFDVGKRPWIQPDEATAEAVARAVISCPTGALNYLSDSLPPEPTPEENTLRVEENGPVYARGDITLEDHDGEPVSRETRLALCRCGASDTKPLCNGAHADVDFPLPGDLGSDSLKTDESSTAETLTLRPAKNGPLLVYGNVSITSADRSTTYTGNKTSLCRCGYSENKPFCDGSHRREGWQE